ncbi:MAG: 2-C-methyl-D-erythritol 2,4-cyclodiphosphate synthase [Prevotella sp.]|nr:2-C-methyl-D-erythritol 2,4-cyclodiphosphate synthase [Prevotella sp.]
MRQNPTEAESILWKYLSGNKMGTHFRRQHPVYGYIPDFVSIKEKIIIEIDGGYHFEGEQPGKDKERTDWLNKDGFVVLRFTNEEVTGHIDYVLEEISDALEDSDRTNQSPLPLGGVGGGFRIGFGYDVHQLVEGRDLWLGGIKIDHSLGLLGHSDADVLIHAICDALLGAACMRDIGYHFPDTAAETDGIDSKILLAKTMQLLRDKGYELGNIDATVCAERPKLNPHIPQMQQCLADVIGCDPGQVSIKATTTEKLGFTGRQEGISAYAVVLISS